jgi:DNA polymerase I-like protein with 3'-5' exonuclease and polymerase domains
VGFSFVENAENYMLGGFAVALFLRCDLSQAEDRVVKILSHDQELIKLARTNPSDFDVHTYNASIVFQTEEKNVTKAQRYASKRCVHLSNYDGSPERASDALLEEGFFVSVAECAAGRDRYRKRFPGIAEYHRKTREQVIGKRRLEGWNGFTIEFKFERLDDALFRRAYAWRPQHFVGTLLNQGGVIPAYEYIKRKGFSSRLAFQVHDEIAIAVAGEREAWDLARVVSEGLERAREYEGESLSIPAEFALERRYHGREGEVIEYRRFPDERQFKEDYLRLDNKRRELEWI